MSLLRQRYTLNEKKAVSFQALLQDSPTFLLIQVKARPYTYIMKIHDPKLIIGISNYLSNIHFVPSTKILSLRHLKNKTKQKGMREFLFFIKFVILFERH